MKQALLLFFWQNCSLIWIFSKFVLQRNKMCLKLVKRFRKTKFLQQLRCGIQDSAVLLRRGEDEEDQRQIFCLPCSSHPSDLLCVSLRVCVCVSVHLHPCSRNRGGKQRNNILLLKRHFDWHKPSVVLFCILLLVYLPKLRTLSGGQDIKEEKCTSTEPAATQHNWQPQSHEWTHIDSFQGVN